MPLIQTKEFEWSQNENQIFVNVNRRNAAFKDIDILISHNYIRIFYRPFFCEIYLFDDIDIEKSFWHTIQTTIHMVLMKCTKTNWLCLEKQLDKSQKLAVKEQARKSIENWNRSQFESYQLQSKKTQDLMISQQIKLDQMERERIQKAKDDLLNEALANLQLNNCSAIKQTCVILPEPRQSQVLEVKFTEREFLTPSRESKCTEEDEWLKKTMEAQRMQGFLSSDLRDEERNPLFIQQKIDQFLNHQNYLAALNACTFGTQLSPNYFYFYMKRAEIQYKLRNFTNVLKDCSHTLELLSPETETNADFRAICLAKRAAALRQLQMFEQADDELQAALKVQPTNYILKKRLKDIFNS